ncbi:kinectin [Trichonephila clavipes]|nr:kinectin [Trichonephila clavipes]
MEKMHHLARERIDMASEKMKTRYDARATGHDFHEGDKVWLWNPKRRKRLSPKQQTNWEGPYRVLKRLNDVVVRIQKSPYSKPKNSSFVPPAVASVSFSLADSFLFHSGCKKKKKNSSILLPTAFFGAPRTRFGSVKPSLPALFPSRPRDITPVSASSAALFLQPPPAG